MKTIYVKHLWRDTLKKVSVVRRINWEKTISAAMFLCAMFFLGREVAATLQGAREAEGTAVSSEVIRQETENWGLGFGKAGEKPVGNASISEMKQYDAYYMAEGEDKVLYPPLPPCNMRRTASFQILTHFPQAFLPLCQNPAPSFLSPAVSLRN